MWAKCTEHILTERCEDELLLAKMDAKADRPGGD